MGTVLGYILSGIGIVTLALSQEKVKNGLSIGLLEAIPSKSLMILGVALVIGGVLVLISANKGSSKIKQAQEEVPIYEGEGKKRKIVGYRKVKN